MSLRDGARRIRADVATLVRAVRDPHAPRAAKLLAVLIVLYVVSPFDLVPDWRALTGLADDLLVVAGGLAAIARLIPPEQLADHRARVEAGGPPLPRGRARPLAGAVMWLVALTALAWWGFGWVAGA
ncbi:YkvA family protein [Salinarimonas chemoclinalis]|uniref:YkvA family protein n=1 Tax=Salinarimonas chemoclinalis TaxID=3241599 RepID=UPI003555C8D0